MSQVAAETEIVPVPSLAVDPRKNVMIPEYHSRDFPMRYHAPTRSCFLRLFLPAIVSHRMTMGRVVRRRDAMNGDRGDIKLQRLGAKISIIV